MNDYGVPSASCDAVMAAEHPSPENGGPCGTCAFRQGSEANASPHTVALARLCVEALRPFYCHEQPQVCRGFIAAANVRGVPEGTDDRRWADVSGMVADMFAEMIAQAAEADRVKA